MSPLSDWKKLLIAGGTDEQLWDDQLCIVFPNELRFLGILWIAGINRYTLPDLDMRILNPTFGASAVLLFGVPESKLSQPRNFLGAPQPPVYILGISQGISCPCPRHHLRQHCPVAGVSPPKPWAAGMVHRHAMAVLCEQKAADQGISAALSPCVCA